MKRKKRKPIERDPMCVTPENDCNFSVIREEIEAERDAFPKGSISWSAVVRVLAKLEEKYGRSK